MFSDIELMVSHTIVIGDRSMKEGLRIQNRREGTKEAIAMDSIVEHVTAQFAK